MADTAGRDSDGLRSARPLQRRGREAVVRLLDAAEDVFGELGLHGATVEDIVARSGMARTTFYDYFADKEELFHAVLIDVADELRAHAATIAPITRTPASRVQLAAWVDDFVATYLQHAPLVRAWTEAEVADTELGILGSQLRTDMGKSVAAAIAGGDGEGVDPGIAAMALVTMIERLSYYAIVGLLDGAGGRTSLVEAIVDVMRETVLPTDRSGVRSALR